MHSAMPPEFVLEREAQTLLLCGVSHRLVWHWIGNTLLAKSTLTHPVPMLESRCPNRDSCMVPRADERI